MSIAELIDLLMEFDQNLDANVLSQTGGHTTVSDVRLDEDGNVVIE